MRTFILEVTWVLLMAGMGFGLYSHIKINYNLKAELADLNKTREEQENTIRQLQIDFIKLTELANRNAEAYEKATKDTTSKKVKKVTIGNLKEVKKQIQQEISDENSTILTEPTSGSNLNNELGRLWNRYQEKPKK